MQNSLDSKQKLIYNCFILCLRCLGMSILEDMLKCESSDKTCKLYIDKNISDLAASQEVCAKAVINTRKKAYACIINDFIFKDILRNYTNVQVAEEFFMWNKIINKNNPFLPEKIFGKVSGKKAFIKLKKVIFSSDKLTAHYANIIRRSDFKLDKIDISDLIYYDNIIGKKYSSK